MTLTRIHPPQESHRLLAVRNDYLNHRASSSLTP